MINKQLKCSKVNKQYVIPTKNWLVPLEQLQMNDVSTKGKFVLSKLFNQEKIIVKVTSNNYPNEETRTETTKKLQTINRHFKKMPNMLYTFCVFSCFDNFNNIFDDQQFCTPSKYSKPVNLELMYNYKKGSLTKYLQKLDKNKVHHIMEQLLYCQLNIFAKYGYTHNDVHLGNILINTHKDMIELNYKKINKIVVTKYEYVLSDYDNVLSFDSPEFSTDYCLFANLTTTVNIVQSLLKTDSLMNFIPVQEKYEESIMESTEEQLNVFINNSNKKEFIKNQQRINLEFVESILELFLK